MASLEDYYYTQEKVLEEKVDWLNDRIQPFVVFTMPDGGTIEYPLGIFILSTPSKRDENGQIIRDVEAYDGLVILDQDKFLTRTTFLAGTTYLEVIKSILESASISKIKLDIDSSKVLSNDKEYEIGRSKLEVINELLTEINYTSLWVDSYGYYVSSPYVSPVDRPIDYTYADNELSIVIEGVEEELDLFEVPNAWVVTVSNPEGEPMSSSKLNTNGENQTSIPARGRTIVDVREIDDINSQADLDAYVERIAFEASQVYGRVIFKTPIMPFHEYYDVIQLSYSPLEINDKFAEMNWTIPLEAGAEMTHELRKVVSLE